VKLSEELSGWVQEAPTGLLLKDILPRVKKLESDSDLLAGLIEILYTGISFSLPTSAYISHDRFREALAAAVEKFRGEKK
jgi:hypothetical protein